VVSYFGPRVFDAMKSAGPRTWIVTGAVVAAIAVGFWLHTRARTELSSRG